MKRYILNLINEQGELDKIKIIKSDKHKRVVDFLLENKEIPVLKKNIKLV